MKLNNIWLHVKDISNNGTTVLLVSCRGFILRAKHLENAIIPSWNDKSGLQFVQTNADK